MTQRTKKTTIKEWYQIYNQWETQHISRVNQRNKQANDGDHIFFTTNRGTYVARKYVL